MKYEEVLRHLGQHQERLRARYLYALSGMTRAQLDEFRRVWPSFSVERRRAIVRSLAELTEHSYEVNFDAIFLLALGDEDPEVRSAAIEGLWEYENPALIEPLIYLLRTDCAYTVRAAAAAALGRFVLLGELEKLSPALSQRVEEVLRATINQATEHTEVRRRAVEAIAYSGKAYVRQIIQAAYHSDDDRMQASALFAMGRSADPYWRELLAIELDNPNPALRYEAARACGELETSQAVPRLAEMAFNDPDREVQSAAVWALACIGGREARAALEACYASDDELLSQAAGEALDHMDMLSDDVLIPLYDEDTEEEDGLDEDTEV